MTERTFCRRFAKIKTQNKVEQSQYISVQLDNAADSLPRVHLTNERECYGCTEDAQFIFKLV
jgi:hypothetical protein